MPTNLAFILHCINLRNTNVNYLHKIPSGVQMHPIRCYMSLAYISFLVKRRQEIYIGLTISKIDVFITFVTNGFDVGMFGRYRFCTLNPMSPRFVVNISWAYVTSVCFFVICNLSSFFHNLCSIQVKLLPCL